MTNYDPIELLSSLAGKAKEQQKRQEHQDLLKEEWQGIAFLCGMYAWMTPLTSILEICPCPKLIPIPGVKNWFRGIVSLRGDFVPITDLQGLLFNTKTEIEKNTQVLVIPYNGELVGILVNQIIALHRIYKVKPRPLSQLLPESKTVALSAYIFEEIQQAEKIFPLFDFYKLIQSPVFSNV